MEYAISLIGFTLLHAYGGSIKYRKAINMPLWWSTSDGGRAALGLLDIACLLCTFALVIWAFVFVKWWIVILLFLAGGMMLAPQIAFRFEPFTTAQICGLPLIALTIYAWTVF